MGVEELLARHVAGGRRASAGGRGVLVAPALRTVVITCMDARIDPVALFGLRPGDAHVLRNAGGIVTDDVERSLTISQRKLGTSELMIVQHTGCGMSTFTDDEFSEELAADVGTRPPWRPGAVDDPVSGVRRGMARLGRSPFLLAGSVIRGFVLDIDRFEVTEVHLVEDAPDFSR